MPSYEDDLPTAEEHNLIQQLINAEDDDQRVESLVQVDRRDVLLRFGRISLRRLVQKSSRRFSTFESDFRSSRNDRLSSSSVK